MTDETKIKTLQSGVDDMSSLTFKSKKQIEDNPLLEALTLVIESNAEYARGVTTILDSDLEREVLLTEIKKEIIGIKNLVEKNREDIIKANSQILIVLDKLGKLDIDLADQLRKKLGPLYIAANLQDTGEQYNPTDKLVVTFGKVLSSKLFAMLSGAIIILMVKFLIGAVK